MTMLAGWLDAGPVRFHPSLSDNPDLRYTETFQHWVSLGENTFW